LQELEVTLRNSCKAEDLTVVAKIAGRFFSSLYGVIDQCNRAALVWLPLAIGPEIPLSPVARVKTSFLLRSPKVVERNIYAHLSEHCAPSKVTNFKCTNVFI